MMSLNAIHEEAAVLDSSRNDQSENWVYVGSISIIIEVGFVELVVYLGLYSLVDSTVAV